MRWLHRVVFFIVVLLSAHTRLALLDLQSNAAAARQPQGTSRSVASPSASKNADYLQDQLHDLPAAAGAKIFRQSFLMTIPVVEACEMLPRSDATSSDAPLALPVWPLLPMGGRSPYSAVAGPEANPPISTSSYGHAGTFEDLKGKPIAGRIVALEIDAPESIVGWQRCASLGAAGIIFLGTDTTPTPAFLEKSTTVPLGIPRFYCDDPRRRCLVPCRHRPPSHLGTLTNSLGGKTSRQHHLHPSRPRRRQRGRWNGGEGSGDWINQWTVLQARYDASSQIMNRAPGATSCVNATVMLDLAQQIAQAPSHCGVVLLWTAGDEWNFHGTRAFLDLVDRTDIGRRDPAQVIPNLQRQLESARTRLTDASHPPTNPPSR